MAKGERVTLYGVLVTGALVTMGATRRSQSYKLDTRNSAWYWNVVIPLEDGHLTPQAAIEEFRAKTQESINGLERKIDRLKAASLKALEALEQMEAREEKGGGDE